MEAGFYGVSTIGSPMGEGVTGSRAAVLNGVLKTNVAGAPYQVANEFICARLASVVGLPVPPGTIVTLDDGDLAYAMMRFGIRGDRLPPADPVEVASSRPQIAARLVAFDSLVINLDRHSGNLAFAPEVGLSVYDHGHALLGTQAGAAEAHCTEHRDKAVITGCLLPHLVDADHLFQATVRMASVPDDVVQEICEIPQRLGLITASERKAVGSMLNVRKKRLRDDIWKHQDRFPGIDDWGIA